MHAYWVSAKKSPPGEILKNSLKINSLKILDSPSEKNSLNFPTLFQENF